MNQYYN